MKDFRLLFTTRIVRMFAYGLLSVVLALHLVSLGLSEAQIGLLLSLTLAGDAAITLWITTQADRIGRRRMLVAGAALMVMAGGVFVLTHDFVVLTIAAIIGVISPSGNDIGPFLSIEQAALTQLVPSERRTHTFAWYNLAGSFATATGALAGGALAQGLQDVGNLDPASSYRVIVACYAALGALLAVMFVQLSQASEAPVSVAVSGRPMFLGLHQSRNIVLRLSSLFALDAFGGALIVQSIMAYWFQRKFGLEPAVLGSIFFFANILAGISALSAARLARKFGLINTMVMTHIPSNVLLILVPFMPTLPLAIGVLLVRFSISQMDVPTRQSYVMAVVAPEERSAAAGVTAIARSIGSTFAPAITGQMLAASVGSPLPFVAAGVLKIIYDLAIWRGFVKAKPPEER